MKKDCLVRLLVIVIIVYNISVITCCSHIGPRVHSDDDTNVNERVKRGLVLLVPYKDNDNSNEDAPEKSSSEVEEIINKKSSKSKRNFEDPSSIFLRHSDMLDANRYVTQYPKFPNRKENKDDSELYIRMKSISDPKEFIKQLIQVGKARKDKRNTDYEDPIAIIVGRKINKPRSTRQKKYMCYCKEADCRGRQCRNQVHHERPWKNTMFPNVKEYINDEYEEDTSAEEADAPTVGAYNSNGGYTKTITSAPSTTTEPTKFSIPFANNINFDQRIIVSNKKSQTKKLQNRFPFYQTPQMKIRANQPYPVYQYSTHTMPQPGIIYPGGPPIQQHYPAILAPKLTVPNREVPSVFGSNFPNINECIKLYGRTVCVISASTKPPISKVETIDLTNDKLIKAYSKGEEDKLVGSYATVTANPLKMSKNGIHTQIPPIYPTRYGYQTSSATTPRIMVNELNYSDIYSKGTTFNVQNNMPQVEHKYYIDKNYFENSLTTLPTYNIEYKELSHPDQYNYQNTQEKSVQMVNDMISKMNLQRPIEYGKDKYDLRPKSINYQSVKEIQGKDEYFPKDITAKIVDDTNYDPNVGIVQSMQQSQLDFQSIPKYSVQNLRATTPKLISKEPVDYKNPNNMDNLKLVSDKGTDNIKIYEDAVNPVQYLKVNDPYQAASNSYMPNYSSEKIISNENYKNNIGNPNPMYMYSGSIQNTPLNADRAFYTGDSKLVVNQPFDTVKHYKNENIEQRQLTKSYPAVSSDYVPNYASKEIINNKNYESGIGNPKSMYKYSGIQNTPRNADQLQNFGDTKLVPNQSIDAVKYYENRNIQQERLTGSYPVVNSDYVPNYAPKESKTYENIVGKPKPLSPTDYNYMAQATQVPITTTPIYNDAENLRMVTEQSEVKYYEDKISQQIKYLPNYSSIEMMNTHRNNQNSGIPKSSYIYTIDFHNVQQNVDQTMPAITPVYSSMRNSQSVIHPPVHAVKNYQYNHESPKPIYTYASAYENLPVNSPNSESNSRNLNYYTNTDYESSYVAAKNSNQNNGLKIVEKQGSNNYEGENNKDKFYQGTIVDSIQQNNTGNLNTDINNYDQYEAQNSANNYAKNNKTPESQSYNLQNEQSSIQEYALSIKRDKSAHNPEQNTPALNPSNGYESIVSAQNPALQIPLPSYSLQQSIQPPEHYNIENTNSNVTAGININTSLRQINNTTDSYGSAKNGNHPDDIAQPVTTLEDVETDEYKNHFNLLKSSTSRAANKLIQEQTEKTKIDNENVGAKHNVYKVNTNKTAQSIPIADVNEESIKKHNDEEALFRGLQKIILENGHVADLSQESYLDNNEGTQETLYGQAGGLVTENSKKYKQSKNFNNITKSESTESLIQSVDDRPSVVYENTSERNSLNYNKDWKIISVSPNPAAQTYDTINNQELNTSFGNKQLNTKSAEDQIKNQILIQSAIKKVINNFVPGKAQDLLVNYGRENTADLVGANIQELLPDILDIPNLKNLFSLPEVENMITDTAGNLLYQLTGLPIIGNIPHLIKNILHNVIGQIPRPHPTVAPMTIDQTISPMTIEEHRYEDGQWVTEQVPLYETYSNVGAANNAPKEIFEKLESIINRSELGKQTAAHPVVQNLIIKAVKHSSDQERRVIDESTIRQAYNRLIQARTQSPPKLTAVTKKNPGAKTKKPLILQPKTTTPMSNSDYKIAPIIPVTEHVLRGGVWFETQKNLVGKVQKDITDFSEDRKRILLEKLDQQQLNKTIFKNEAVTYDNQQKNVNFNEEKKELMQEQLDQPKLDKTMSKSISFTSDTQQSHGFDSSAANTAKDFEKSKIVAAKLPDYAFLNEEIENKADGNTGLSEDKIDDSIERKPIKYYSPNDRILEYIKNHQSTDNPYFTTAAEIVGYDDNIETTTRQIGLRSSENLTNNHTPELSENSMSSLYTEPSVTQSNQRQSDNIEKGESISEQISKLHNLRNSQPLLGNPIEQQINTNNRLNLLVEPKDVSLKSENQTPRIDESRLAVKTGATRQANDQLNLGQVLHMPGNTVTESQDPIHMGRLVPVDYRKTSQTRDLTDLQDASLVYVGDGVRLPLTIRKLQDGTFALTLSDEVCKRFVHKECPCCLPSGNNGVIMRERRSGEEISELNFMDDEVTVTSQESEDMDLNTDSNVSRVRRRSEELGERTTINSEESQENSSDEVDKVNQFVRKVVNLDNMTERSRTMTLVGAMDGLVNNESSTLDIDTQTTNNNDDYSNKWDRINGNQAQTESSNMYKNDRSKKDTTRATTASWHNYDNDENRNNIKTSVSYQTYDTFLERLKQGQSQENYSQNSGPPYKYQRYANENVPVRSRTETLKNILHGMKELVRNEQ